MCSRASGNPLGSDLVLARMAADLFGVGEAPGVGRFQLLNRIVSGGMGVIYAAPIRSSIEPSR